MELTGFVYKSDHIPHPGYQNPDGFVMTGFVISGKMSISRICDIR